MGLNTYFERRSEAVFDHPKSFLLNPVIRVVLRIEIGKIHNHLNHVVHLVSLMNKSLLVNYFSQNSVVSQLKKEGALALSLISLPSPLSI